MIEVAMVFDPNGRVLFWHEPPGRSGGSIPDSRSLWEVLWENRDYIAGVAHTHPWKGNPVPSLTDVTTFKAVEAGLGIPLLWPIVTADKVSFFAMNPKTGGPTEWEKDPFEGNPWWEENIEELRHRSLGGQDG